MNQELTVYFEKQPQRVEVDEAGAEWWIVLDVCKCLELKNVTEVIKRIPKQHLSQIEVLATDGRKRRHWAVDEAGLNYLIMGSDSPKAAPYKEWNYAVVLPSIRKTGSYSVAPKMDLQILKHAVDVLLEHENRLNALEQKQQAITAVLPPIHQITPRKQISQVVRTFANKEKLDYEPCFNGLYRQFKYRNGIDLKERAKNARSSPMQIAEELGKIMDLLSLAIYLFVEGNYSG